MEVKYDKTAILEYIANFRELQELMRRDMDESLNQYKVCKQEYSRIFTECEEESRRAYNRVLSAESEIQMANMMMEQAMRAGTDSDEGESQIDYDMISRAQEMRMQAEADLVAAKADYTRAQDNISKLNAVMEKYGPALESESKLVNDTFTECSIVGSKAGEALEQYIGVMEKAHAALYEGATPQMSSRGSGSSSAGSSGNGDANGSSGVASSGLGNAQTISGNTSSGAGTQIMGAVASGGFLFSIAGQKKEFENSKAGLNQAYKEAIKANDKSAAAEIKQAFDNFGKSNGNMQSRKVNTEKNLQNTQWSDVEYFNVSDKIRKADQNSNVLKWSGEMGNSLRVPKDKSGELSQSLRDFGVEGIQYVNGDVDFSPVT